METYAIKPLEWEEHGLCSNANTVFGDFEVYDICWFEPGNECDAQKCTSRDHGKELAEAWYRAKLSEALTRVES